MNRTESKFTSIYSVVDGFFVSNFAGKTAFASVNLIFPFIMVLGGMGFMIGTGGTALVSLVLGVLFTRPVAGLLGATPEMMEDCVLYGRIVLCFTATFMLQNVFQSFLIAAEKPKFGLMATVSAGVTNMFLDALFVGVFRWGVAGTALATGVSQCVGGLLPLIYFILPNTSLLRLTRAKLEIKPILQACTNGSSELMSNISSSIVSMIYNFQLLRYVGENGVSAYGVLMYVQFIFIAIYIGYSIGAAPVISYHYGAGNYDELKNMLKKSAVLMAGASLVLTAAF